MRKIKPAVLLCVSLMLCACNFENFDKRCAREAKEYTEKQCPRRMDPYTVMDSLTYQEHTHTLAYHYTLEGKLDNDSILTRELFDAFAQQLRKELINSVDLKMYKEKKVNFRYCYYSKSSGKLQFETLLTPQDYGEGAR